MPPWLMRASVCSVRWRSVRSRVSRPVRQISSSTGACGNLGAPPIPPWTASTCSAMARATRSAKAASGRSPPSEGAAAPPPPRGRREPLQGRHELVPALVDAPAVLPPEPRYLLQHLREARAAVARLGREIGAAPERLARGREEHGERPAALLAHQRQRVLVDGVDVRPLLPVDLDADEFAVHRRRDLRALQALVRHDGAPVAAGVAGRAQARLVLPPRQRQRLVRPPAPLDRVVLVLEEVGAAGVAERVRHGAILLRGRGRPYNGLGSDQSQRVTREDQGGRRLHARRGAAVPGPAGHRADAAAHAGGDGAPAGRGGERDRPAGAARPVAAGRDEGPGAVAGPVDADGAGCDGLPEAARGGRPEALSTVYAPATAAGRAAVGMVRVSGPKAAAVCRALTGRPLPPPRRAVLRHLADPADGAPIDQAVLVW